MRLEHVVSNSEDGKTVKYIIEKCFSLSSSVLTKLKKTSGIKLNGSIVTVRQVALSGDVLTLTLTDEIKDNIVPYPFPLDILYEDEYLLAVNKPQNMPTHPSFKHHSDTLANAVMYYCRKSPFTFRALTRLDIDTTGVVLIAKDTVVCSRLSEQMNDGRLKKQYCAICVGVPTEKSGIIDAPISREENSVIKRCINSGGKYAVTRYEVIKATSDEKYSLLRLYPKTGRTHQIRLHLAFIGHPIYGDFLYGTPIDGERTRLHCECITFVHPVNGNKLIITAPIPKDITSFQ